MASVSKILSANDLGLTGGHQSGILVPKQLLREIEFFPELDAGEKNPRVKLDFHLGASGETLQLNFIYYNSKLFGGSRNEFRLTGLTPYLRRIGASPGDCLKMSERHGRLYLEHEPRALQAATKRIVLSGEWAINV
mgnify:CR=1 FL=1